MAQSAYRLAAGDGRRQSLRRGYLERLKSQADERVQFKGAIYGDGYWGLQKHAGIARVRFAKWEACTCADRGHGVRKCSPIPGFVREQ
jgi:hypothetical protein